MGEPKLSEKLVQPGTPRAIRRWLQLIAVSLVIVGMVAILTLVMLWYHALMSTLVVRWIRIHMFHILYAGYVAILAVIPVGLIGSIAAGVWARRRKQHRVARWSARAILVWSGLLIGIGLCEMVCTWKLAALAHLAHPPVLHARFQEAKPGSSPLRQASVASSPVGTFEVVTIGESSAKGVPFYPWTSLDRIITWQLGRAFPGATFNEDNRAIPGITLETAIEQLAGLERRPDLLIVYSGHNEFQSRFGWGRKAPHYRVEPKVSPLSIVRGIRSWSRAAEFFGRNADRLEIEVAPPPRYERDPADSPCCSPAEYAATLNEYRRRLDGLLADCAAAGIMTMVIVPPSNDGAFDPNHSILSADTTLAGQRDFIERVMEVRRGSSADPAGAIADYRRLIDEQPGFAETRYRLGQLLEAAGSYPEAREAYIRARDLDGIPFRCPTPFLDVCREVGRRHGSIVIDAPRLLESASPHGIVNDRLFADAHHPALNTLVILGRDAIGQLKQRRAFGWPDAVPAPPFSMADCIAHFDLHAEAWITVCKNSWKFFGATINLPRDSTWRWSVATRYAEAIELLEAGKSPDETGIPSLQTRDELRADLPPDPSS